MLPGREDQEILEKLKEVELVDNTPKTEKEKVPLYGAQCRLAYVW